MLLKPIQSDQEKGRKFYLDKKKHTSKQKIVINKESKKIVCKLLVMKNT